MLELNFKDFYVEMRRGPAPGAFGNTKSFTPSRNNSKRIGPIDSTNSDYNARIQAGFDLETEIREKLAELGIMTIDSSGREDTQFGIDGYITSTNGGKTLISPQTPFQLKARKNSSGNDILWETIKPWNDSIKNNFELFKDAVFTGKDMRCKAKLLISLGNDGQTIRLRKVSETMEIAKKMTEILIEKMRSTNLNFAQTQWGQVRLVTDPSKQATATLSGNVRKINCFISPEAYEWKQNIQLKSPIGLV